MKTLILDTSQTTSILGLAKGKNLLLTHFFEGKSSLLLPALETFCSLKELTCIAVGVGPGSYMGIRTAATVAKTLSYSLKIPLIAFPSPLAFLPEKAGIYSIIGDAKMQQLYTIKISVQEERVRILTPPLLISLEEKDTIAISSCIDLRSLPTPNLHWVCLFSHAQFMQGNILDANSLKLNYLRY